MVPYGTTVVAGLSHSLFQRRTVLAGDDLFWTLGIAGHRLFLDWKQGGEVIGKQTVDGPGLVNPVLVNVWRKFVESVDEAYDGNEIEALPCPLEAGITFPFIPTLIRSAWVRSSAGQVAWPWPELREDELREEEFIQVGYLSLRSEGPPLRWPLVVKAEVKPASLLRTEVLICNCDTGDESASIALDNSWSGAIEHLLSQRSGHNSGALYVPKVNRDIQPRRVFWRVNKAATERARIFRLKIRVASYKGVRFRLEQTTFERIVIDLQR